MGIVAVRETLSRIVGETHSVLKHAQIHPPANQHLKGTECLWEAREVTGSGMKQSKQHRSFSDSSLTDSATMQQRGLPHPGEYLRLCPLHTTGEQRQRNMVQMKEQVKSPEKELSNEEVTSLSDAEFKTLVIRMFTELIELGQK